MQDIVITGAGIVSAMGRGVERVWSAMEAGTTGLKPLTLFRSARCGHLPVGEIQVLPPAPPGMPFRGSRSDRMAIDAVAQALEQAGLRRNDAPLRGAGMMLGGTVGGMLDSEKFAFDLIKRGRASAAALRHHEPASAVDLCCGLFGLSGPSSTLSTACSSGAMAIAAAAQMIESAEADIMLACGADSLSRLTLNGFASLLLVDPEGCRPFDADRSGMNLGEGAAALVLESVESADRRGVRPLAGLSGWAMSCDASHATAPDPQGLGAARAMRGALARAGLAPSEIGYINAHGTGTRDNDASEAAAIRSVFGDNPPAFSSVKRFFGHTLGASGAIEAVICAATLQKQMLPPNPGFSKTDPAIGLATVQAFTPRDIEHVMSNSFGFGGNNVCLVLSKCAPNRRSAGVKPPRAGREPERPLAAVAAVSFISPAGRDFGAVAALSHAGGPAPVEIGTRPPLPGLMIKAYSCAAGDLAGEIDPRKARRMSRLMQMQTAVSLRAFKEAGLRLGRPPENMSVCIGTGLGCMEDSGAFIENMILNDENMPMPARFVNSVHNALASHVAIELKAKSLNSAPTHREICFETALWQAARQFSEERLDCAVAGAADLLDPYVLIAGNRWGWWGGESRPVRPFCSSGDTRHPRAKPLLGEGACAVVLAPENTVAEPLARLRAVRIGRWQKTASGLPDAEAESAWILETLLRNGIQPDSVGMFLAGANGWKPFDDLYLEVRAALLEQAGMRAPLGVYKHLCGEYYSASASGFCMAVGWIAGRLDTGDLARFDPAGPPVAAAPPPGPAGKTALVYTLSPGGARGLVCLSA